MRTPARLALFGCWLLAAGCSRDGPTPGVGVGDDAGKSDAERLQGTWVLKSNEQHGNVSEVPATHRGAAFFRLVIEGRTARRGDNPADTFTIDPSATPKGIDFTATDGPAKGLTFRGIYAFEGATLKICRSVSSEGGRPAEFKTRPGSDTILYVYERQ